MRLFDLLVVAPFVLAAQSPDLCTVQGRVVNAIDNAPVARALLVLMPVDRPRDVTAPPPNYSTTTDSTGNFGMKDIPPGRYRFTASRAGFVNGQYEGFLTLTAAQHLNDVPFRMVPQAVITGKVTDENGEPVMNARVQAVGFRYVQGRKQPASSAVAVSDDRGEYRLFALAPGKYTVSASPMFGGGAPLTDRSLTPRPEEDYTSAEAPAEVAAGAHLQDVDLKLHKSPIFHVRGHVAARAAGPHTFNVSLTGKRTSFHAPADRNGNFDFSHVAPGSYTLQAGTPVDDRFWAATLPVTVSTASVDKLDIVVGPGVAVTGKVRFEGAAAPDLSAVILQAQLQNSDAMNMLSGNSKIRPDGSFRMLEMSPGRYNLTAANLPDGVYLKSPATLDVGAAAPSAIEVVLSSAAGPISGIAKDAKTGHPAAGALIVLIGDDPERALTATTAGDGAFTIRNAVPGHYRAFAFSDPESAGHLDPEFLRNLGIPAVAVQAREGAPQTITLTAQR